MVKVKIIKEGTCYKIGEIITCSNEESEQIINEGFAEIFDESSVGCVGNEGTYRGIIEKNNNNIGIQHPPANNTHTHPSQPTQPTLLLKEEDQPVILHPAVGILNDYYYGFNILSKFKKKIKKKEVIVRELKQVLINKRSNEFVEDLKNQGVQVLGELYQKEPRWDSEDILKYLDKDIITPNFEEVFEIVKREYERYVDFIDEDEYYFQSLWDIGTYFFTLFDTYPYIHLNGLRNTGKSKVMTLSSNITFNAEMSSGMTLATLFRMVQQNRPTLYIEEYEKLGKRQETKEDKEFETLLNNGYKKGLTVPRMEQKGKNWIVARFEVYCPKMIANISGLRGALPSRCIKIVMHRAKQEDPRGDLWPSQELVDWKIIRNKLYILGLEKWKDVQLIYSTLKKKPKISNRDWELWKPILTIAKLVGEEVYQRMCKFAENRVKECKEEEEFDESWDFKLIESLSEVLKEERYYYIKSEIKSVLDRKFDEKQSKPTPEWIGRSLRKFGLKDSKRDGNGVKYFLSQKIVNELLGRLQLNVLKDETPIISEENVGYMAKGEMSEEE